MRRGFCLALALAVIVSVSCEDTTTNNYYKSDAGGIYGTVSPADSGIVRAIGDREYEAPISGEGFFNLDSLPGGVYRLVVAPNHYSHRELRNLVVTSGQWVRLDNVSLSKHPYPIYRTNPADSATNVYPSNSIVIYADERLVLSHLSNHVQVTPQVQGHWVESPQKDFTWNYTLVPDDQSSPFFKSGTTYQVVIQLTETESGTPIAGPVTFSFITRPIEARVYFEPNNGFDEMTIWNFSARLILSECVNNDSVTRGVTFDPEITGMWIPDHGASKMYCSDSDWSLAYQFFVTTPPLTSNTHYRMIIGRQLGMVKPDTFYFVTEPIGVSYCYPSNGNTFVPADTYIHLTFNVQMDTATVNRAFSLEELESGKVAGQCFWQSGNQQMNFVYSPSPLKTLGVYKITVTREARTIYGVPIDVAFESYFSVQ